jgi:hypothetical protein
MAAEVSEFALDIIGNAPVRILGDYFPDHLL